MGRRRQATNYGYRDSCAGCRGGGKRHTCPKVPKDSRARAVIKKKQRDAQAKRAATVASDAATAARAAASEATAKASVPPYSPPAADPSEPRVDPSSPEWRCSPGVLLPGEDATSKALRSLINKGRFPLGLALAVFMKAEQAGAVRRSLASAAPPAHCCLTSAAHFSQGGIMRGMKRVKTSKGLLLQSKQLIMRGAWARKAMASAFGAEEREREAFCQVTRLPAWLGNEWGEEPDKTLPAPYLRWIAEMCRIGTPPPPPPSPPAPSLGLNNRVRVWLRRDI